MDEVQFERLMILGRFILGVTSMCMGLLFVLTQQGRKGK